jgi:hypothetical protein
MVKSYKTSKHPNKIHILQKYAIKINILKLSSNKKKMDSFAYLKWGILDKIWIKTEMLANWVLEWLDI